MDQRRRFLEAYLSGKHSIVALCAKYGVSRSTGHRLIRRYALEGFDCLHDRSRAPLTRPTRTAPEIATAICGLRRKHPTWGSKKICVYLARRHPDVAWPARSTVDEILKREGFVVSRKVRPDYRYRAKPFVRANRPNEAWTADYKGWFRLGDGTRCEPLTINDMYSRFSLACRPFQKVSGKDVQSVFRECFQEYGLPQVVLTDNGPPFGSTGRCGLTWLSVWLLQLGVIPTHIQPGKPQQNSKHERFHLTLKKDAASPPRSTWRAQQSAIRRFRGIYNNERPHESLGMKTPSEVYEKSLRRYEGDPEDFEYPCHLETRRVRANGHMNWEGKSVFIGESIAKQVVGLEPRRRDVWRIWLGPLAIGDLDLTKKPLKLKPIRKRRKPS